MDSDCLLLGGDARQTALAGLLARQGRVHTLAVPELVDTAEPRPYGLVVLPCPALGVTGALFSSSGAGPDPASLKDYLGPDTVVLGGALGELGRRLSGHCARVADLLADEITVTQNAALTAQAAVILTQTHTKSSLFQKPCLILGWGRIAKALARLLSGWGALVTVLARSPAARAEADSWGLAALRPDEKPGPFSFVFNTVPAQVLTGEALESLGPDCLWVELASRPYGLCPEDRVRVRQLFAGNLPGRILPVSAAEILYRGICRHLEGGAHGG